MALRHEPGADALLPRRELLGKSGLTVRRVAAVILASTTLVGSCSLRDPSTSGPGNIPRCTSGEMRCWGNSLWACNAQQYWVQIQDCTKTGQSCYENNPGRCGSNRPCCAG